MYTQACISALADQLTHLGRLVSASTQWAHPIRGPLSLHLPLCRHAACFLCLAIFTHRTDVRQLMKPFLEPNPNVLRRLMEELANVLVKIAFVYASLCKVREFVVYAQQWRQAHPKTLLIIVRIWFLLVDVYMVSLVPCLSKHQLLSFKQGNRLKCLRFVVVRLITAEE